MVARRPGCGAVAPSHAHAHAAACLQFSICLARFGCFLLLCLRLAGTLLLLLFARVSICICLARCGRLLLCLSALFLFLLLAPCALFGLASLQALFERVFAFLF